MSNPTATQTIFQAVEHAKARAKSARQTFDRADDRIQHKIRQPIDVFGASARSTVSDIASSVRRAFDDLYSSLQSLVITVDESCRPLLSEKPDLSAVKAVVELMAKLNEDSELHCNVGASLNGSNIGDMAGISYAPSMECKMIQRYWEDRYAAWPGRAEQEAEAQKQKEAVKKQREQSLREQKEAEKRKDQTALEDYQKRKQEWETQCKQVQELRRVELEEKYTLLESESLAKLRETYKRKKQQLEEEKAQADRAIIKAQYELEQAGVFSFSVKQAAKATIKQKQQEREELLVALQKADDNYQVNQAKQKQDLIKTRENLKQNIEKQYPFPTKPRKPFLISKAREQYGDVDACLQEALLKSLTYGKRYTVTEIMEAYDILKDLPANKTRSLLHMLVPEYLERKEESRIFYFRLV